MAHRGYIAKVEPDGSGRYIYLGHASYPSAAGTILLHHYQDPRKLDTLLSMGSIPNIEPELPQITPYFDPKGDDWPDCRPVDFQGGTNAFFLVPYMPSPEWLYCWTPDGWLAAPVQSQDIPRNFFDRLTSDHPTSMDDWFYNNQEPQWVQWRAACLTRQEPQPLLNVINNYNA